MKNQLFAQIPDLNFVNKLLNIYGLEYIEDTKEFTKNDLKSLNIIKNIENFISELVLYYLPCKYKIVLNNITLNKTLTILRQIIKLYDYELKKREHVQNKKKIIYYHIKKKYSNIIINNKNVNPDKCVLKFN
jgi:hypothetical protein|tara:strand:+ start:316 stop:711 length:396 start_codon:yes stop_codon:yes gene_type:complete